MSQVINIIPLHAITDICNNSIDIANQLRVLADKIEQGEYSNVRIACTVIDCDKGIYRYSLGPAGTCKIEIAGLLAYGLHRLCDSE